MALPTPQENEAREAFLDRCMLDSEAREQYPDSGNRFAFASARWEMHMVTKSDEPRTLYISRPVLNADELIAWAKKAGFETTYQPEDLHVTQVYSRRPLDWFTVPPAMREVHIPAGGPRMLQRLGDKGAVVLRFNCPALAERWKEVMELGASWDYDAYRPHVTITLNAAGLDLSQVEPYQGEIILGMEKFGEVKEHWQDSHTEKLGVRAQVLKVEGEKRIAYGWFSVVEEMGLPVVDHHADIISEETLVAAAHKYMLESRAGKVMHKGKRVADVVESVVFTKDLQQALGINLGKVGWFGGMQFRDDEIWAKVKKGELKEFSIGGFSHRLPL